jgi:F0F1-type ATP synthase delta subunit
VKPTATLYAQALVQSLKEGSDQKKIINQFFKFLIRHNKQKLWPSILRKVNQIEMKNSIVIETAHSIDSKQKVTLQNKAKEAFPYMIKPVFIFNQNPGLIGGFTIKNLYQEINSSVEGNLEKIKEQLWQTK